MEIIAQIIIVVFGAAAIWLIGRREVWKRWGYIIGLCSQPAFLYTAWQHEQWGIFLLALWYAYSYGQGIYNYWVFPKLLKEELL